MDYQSVHADLYVRLVKLNTEWFVLMFVVPQLFFFNTCVSRRLWMRNRAELFNNYSVPGDLIPSGWIYSRSSSSMGSCSDKIQIGFGTSTPVSPTIGIAHLEKVTGSREHRNCSSSFLSVVGLELPSIPRFVTLHGELTSFLAFLAQHWNCLESWIALCEPVEPGSLWALSFSHPMTVCYMMLITAGALCVHLETVPSSVSQVGTLLFNNAFLTNILLGLQCS